ncbi:MAG TPA: hypothetical protein VEK07_12540 [Polyangiaceae bacterium]|nr:hypothetical protein [Polyangiaceae bacterium]
MSLGAVRRVSILFRLGGFGVVATCAAAYGCSGDAFTLAPADAAAPSNSSGTGAPDGSGAPTDGGADAPSDGAAASFCSAYTLYTLCESFDVDGAPGQLTPVTGGTAAAGTIATDSTTFFSAPNSMEATTPAVTTLGASARALAGKTFASPGTQLYLQAEFQVIKSCLTTDGVTIELVTMSLAAGAEYSVALTLASTGSYVTEILTAADGGVSTDVHDDTSVLTAGDWSNVKLTIHLDKKTFDLMFGATGVSAVPLTEEPVTAAAATAAAFAVGASVTYTTVQSTGCTVYVDNVVFNDTVMLP